MIAEPMNQLAEFFGTFATAFESRDRHVRLELESRFAKIPIVKQLADVFGNRRHGFGSFNGFDPQISWLGDVWEPAESAQRDVEGFESSHRVRDVAKQFGNLAIRNVADKIQRQMQVVFNDPIQVVGFVGKSLDQPRDIGG